MCSYLKNGKPIVRRYDSSNGEILGEHPIQTTSTISPTNANVLQTKTHIVILNGKSLSFFSKSDKSSKSQTISSIISQELIHPNLVSKSKGHFFAIKANNKLYIINLDSKKLIQELNLVPIFPNSMLI